jgi:hypothetical protein
MTASSSSFVRTRTGTVAPRSVLEAFLSQVPPGRRRPPAGEDGVSALDVGLHVLASGGADQGAEILHGQLVPTAHVDAAEHGHVRRHRSKRPTNSATGGRVRSPARKQANQGSPGMRSETGCTSTILRSSRAVAQTNRGRMLHPIPRSTAPGHGPEIGGHQAQPGREGPTEMRLPEPPGDGQLQAVGHPGLPDQPVAEFGQRAEGARARQRGAATRANSLLSDGHRLERPAPGDRAHDSDVELAPLELSEELGVFSEAGHHGQVGGPDPGKDERREELGRRPEPQGPRDRPGSGPSSSPVRTASS